MENDDSIYLMQDSKFFNKINFELKVCQMTHLSPTKKLNALNEDGLKIRYIQYPIYEQCLAAISQNSKAIEYIPNLQLQLSNWMGNQIYRKSQIY